MAVAILVVVYCIYPAFTAQDKLGPSSPRQIPCLSLSSLWWWLRLFVAG